MNEYIVTFTDRNKDLEHTFICESKSPVYAIIKAEETLKLHNWLVGDTQRTICVKNKIK